jgi:hypothetical protein
MLLMEEATQSWGASSFFHRRFTETGGSIEKRVGTIDFCGKTFRENKASFGIELDSDLPGACGFCQFVNQRFTNGCSVVTRGRVYQWVQDFRG